MFTIEITYKSGKQETIQLDSAAEVNAALKQLTEEGRLISFNII